MGEGSDISEERVEARHATQLIEAGVEYQVRETFESALVFGEQVLRGLGFGEREVLETMTDVRRRDEERHEQQLVGGIGAGRACRVVDSGPSLAAGWPG